MTEQIKLGELIKLWRNVCFDKDDEWRRKQKSWAASAPGGSSTCVGATM